MNSYRKNAIMVGVFYIAATVAGILSLVFTEPVINSPDYLVNVSANENQVLIGALFVLIMAVAVAGVAIRPSPNLVDMELSKIDTVDDRDAHRSPG